MAEQPVTVEVPLPGRAYPIDIGSGALRQLGQRLRERCSATRATLITDTNVGPLYTVIRGFLRKTRRKTMEDTEDTEKNLKPSSVNSVLSVVERTIFRHRRPTRGSAATLVAARLR